MKRRLFSGAFVAALAVSALSASALAARPADPGCFGQDRAAWLHLAQDNIAPDQGPAAPGASEWGHIAGDRGATNGQIDRDYKTTCCGGDPS